MKPVNLPSMMIRYVLVVMALFTLAACASGPTRHEIHHECRLEMDAARTAVQLRNKGKDKMTMLRTLPPLQQNSTRLLQQMYRIVDETYAVPGLSDLVFGIYRYEVCVRQLRHLPVPTDINAVHSQLQSCQTRFHRQVSKKLVNCVRAVFPPAAEKTSEKANAG